MIPESSRPGAAGGPRWVMPTLALLFMGPLLAAVAFYYFAGGWRPGSSVNHGRLLNPPVSLVEAALPQAGGGLTQPDFLRGRWSLVYISHDRCATQCLAMLDKLQSVRLALREKAVRVRLVLFYAGEPPDAERLAQDLPGFYAVSVASGEGAALLEPLLGDGGSDPGAAARVYVVDPLGNAMLSYAPDFEMKGMLADLKRLLKLSRIG